MVSLFPCPECNMRINIHKGKSSIHFHGLYCFRQKYNPQKGMRQSLQEKGPILFYSVREGAIYKRAHMIKLQWHKFQRSFHQLQLDTYSLSHWLMGIRRYNFLGCLLYTIRIFPQNTEAPRTTYIACAFKTSILSSGVCYIAHWVHSVLLNTSTHTSLISLAQLLVQLAIFFCQKYYYSILSKLFLTMVW